VANDERRERFEALFEQHYGRVRRYVLRRADAAIADDVVSETFTVAWRRLDDIRVPELPWLLGVARLSLANVLRSERRRQALFERLRQEPPTSGAGDAEGDILRALASLREADREALLLVAWEGLTSAEAAQALDSSVAAFHVRAFRARRRLLRALATEEVSGTPGARTPSAEEAK
jgi:RNA polymerase sigma-70 factor (ECF subfamily)